MKNVKEILTENRESVISSIKWVFKVWKSEDVKAKMIQFLSYAEENANVEFLNESKKVKTDLKVLVQKMAIMQEKKRNLEIYGTERPKLAEIMGRHAERMEDAGNIWHPIYKAWVKNEGFNASMQKNPQFA
jgi:hypothetical protein